MPLFRPVRESAGGFRAMQFRKNRTLKSKNRHEFQIIKINFSTH